MARNENEPFVKEDVWVDAWGVVRQWSAPRRAVAGALVVVAVGLFGLFGTYQARRFLQGDGWTECRVTAASLRYGGESYSGDDHPRNPDVGDRYRGDSGCLAFESQCWWVTELFGNRIDPCYPADPPPPEGG